MSSSKWTSIYIASAGAILLLAGVDRLLIAFGGAAILALPEPLLGVPLRSAIWIVGGFEILVAGICLLGRRRSLQLGLLGWLLVNYAVFRIGLLTMGEHHQGSSIGSLSNPLQLRGGWSGFGIAFFLPAYLLIGMVAALYGTWGRGGFLLKSKYAKMSCPNCGGHIKFAATDLGQPAPCPHCKQSVRLRGPGNLKISCFFCSGHIEFPAHALGTKMPCPHCQKDITLLEPKVSKPAER